MRTLIKKFERLDVESLLRTIAGGTARPARPWTRMAGGWRQLLRRTLAERARSAAQAIDHATGLYFPARLHQARIAIKKLRYALEIAQATGIGPRSVEASLTQLKKSQDALGDLHDRQAFIDELLSPASARVEGVAADHVRLIIQLAEAECHDLHAKYLSRRSGCWRLPSHGTEARDPYADRVCRDAPRVLVGVLHISAGVGRRCTYAPRRRNIGSHTDSD
jgi:CHAD domain-containing protein